jgi:pimeloyl-ACP methyl ester carboxylesterase
MDVLRAALGEPKLNYLGASYGTFIGATYAGLFPSQMGRFETELLATDDNLAGLSARQKCLFFSDDRNV